MMEEISTEGMGSISGIACTLEYPIHQSLKVLVLARDLRPSTNTLLYNICFIVQMFSFIHGWDMCSVVLVLNGSVSSRIELQMIVNSFRCSSTHNNGYISQRKVFTSFTKNIGIGRI